MRLNFVSLGDKDGKRGSTRIRVLNIIKALNQKGWQCAFNDDDFDGYDAIIFQKTLLTKSVKTLIRRARRKNIKVVLDLDDYVEELMPQLKYFDLITVSTEYLKKLCDPWHHEVKIVPNMLDVNDVTIALKDKNKQKKIVWYGYSQNSYILDKWNIKGIKKISDKNCDVIYDADKIDEQLQKFDLVVIPQERNDLTLVKTHCRMLKALYLGLPCLVSDMPVYVELAKELDFPQDFIVSNPEEWNKKIADFKSGKLKFDFDFAAAREKILQKYGADIIAGIFENAIKNFIKQKQQPSAVLDYENELMPISVVLNAHNQADTIKSLKNLYKQTLFDFEIVIIGKNLPEKLFEYASKDKRIRINKNPCGKYVYFMNAGDTISESCLKRMYAAAFMSSADITMMQGFIKNGNKKTIVPKEKCGIKILDVSSILEFLDYPLVFGTCLYKRDFLVFNKVWNPKLLQFPDTDFAYLVWKKCASMFIVPETMLKTIDDDKESYKTIPVLLKNYAKMNYNAENSVLLIIQNNNDIPQAFVTLTSIIENSQSIVNVYIYAACYISAQIREQFECLSNDFVSAKVIELPNYKGNRNRLNILLDILIKWQKDEKVLYVSNSCLATSDLQEIFAMQQDSIISSRINRKPLSLDINIVLFDTALLKEKFFNYPLKKEITSDMWYELMYMHNEEMPERYNYYAEDYNGLSAQMLPAIKFICYKSVKPWKNLYIPFGFLWWQYARNSIFYENILTQRFFNTNNKKLDFSTIINNESDYIYILIKMYLKEAFLYIFSFGNKAKIHKSNLSVIIQKIYKEVEK